MIEELTTTAKQIGDELITMSVTFDKNMEKWSDVSKRPNDWSDTECVGFITKEAADTSLSFVIDVQAPADKEEAALHTWAITSALDSNQTERFNNIQLDFSADYQLARKLAEKGDKVTRDDIRELLHDASTKPVRIMVSNETGFDEASQQPLGERHDLTFGESSEDDASSRQVIGALHAVLPALQKAVSEAAS